MEQIDDADIECVECEACLFREKTKQNKNTLFIFGLILSFFIGALVMFLAMSPLLLERSKFKQQQKQFLDVPESNIIQIYHKPTRILYTI